MESLAYLHLALNYEDSTTEVEINFLPKKENELELKSSSENLKFSTTRQILQGNSKSFLSFKPIFLVIISTATLALTLGLPKPAMALLSRGNCGSDVVLLQKRLKRLGYFPTNIPSTGCFGGTTEASVRNFQRYRGLVVDGKVGSKTSKALGKYFYYRGKPKTKKGVQSIVQNTNVSNKRYSSDIPKDCNISWKN